MQSPPPTISSFFRCVPLVLALCATAITSWAQPDFVFANKAGSTPTDRGNATTTDAAGNIYTTGMFVGTVDFDPGPGIVSFVVNINSVNMFVTKTDAAGNLVWARCMSGSNNSTEGLGIAVDGSGNVLTTGTFTGTTDFNPEAGTFTLSSSGTQDIFVSKLNSSGGFVWARKIGGASADFSRSIAVDGLGNLVITGSFSGTVDFDPLAGTTTMSSFGTPADIFVCKLDAGGIFAWAKQLGGTFTDFGNSVALDGSGNVLTTGFFGGTADFDPGTGVSNLIAPGTGNDIFVSKLDASGTFVWAKQLGGVNDDIGTSISVDGADNVYTTGYFYHGVGGEPADFDPDPAPAATFLLTPFPASALFTDVFVSKLNSSGNFVWARQLGGASEERGNSIDADPAGNVSITGYFFGTGDFDPGGDFVIRTSNGNSDVFICRLNVSGFFAMAEQIGSVGADVGLATTIAQSGHIITTGSFSGPADFAPGPCVYNLAALGANPDMFLQKILPTQIPLPTISGFSPTFGPAGTTVTIGGTNFDPSVVVFFDGLRTTVSATTTGSITTVVPIGATDGSITVTIGCHSVTSAAAFDVTGTCDIPVHERAALAALYSSTGGPGLWINRANWLTADASTWFGVTVSGCRVTEINLPSNNLTNSSGSPIPTTFSFLPALEVLNLHDNNLGGLPNNLGELTALRELNISSNALAGFFPGDLIRCTQLETLNFENNLYFGPIPAFLGSLNNLSSINLSSNGFQAAIPPELGNLANLEFLSLAGNELNGSIPTELGDLDLDVLDLHDNILTGIIPPELGNLPLTSLQLHSNQLDGTIPATFSNLNLVQDLNLSINMLTGSLPTSFSSLTNLQYFSVANNQLSGTIPPSLGTLPNLIHALLDHNAFTSLPAFTSPGLLQLDVQNNSLDFGDLEVNVPISSYATYNYDPQAELPPGGPIFFISGGPLFVPFSTGGSANHYQWYKDGEPIPGATFSNFNKSGATAADAGIYVNKVTSSAVSEFTLLSKVFIVFTDVCDGLARTSGDIDTGFDPHFDAVVPDFGGVETQSTGHTIVALDPTSINSVPVEGIVRFNLDGTLDATFPTNDEHTKHLIVQDDDKILFTSYGGAGPDAYLERFEADGTDDGDFNNNVETYQDGYFNALALAPNGKIVYSVSQDEGPTIIVRINEDGTEDNSFSAPTNLDINTICVLPDESVLLAGAFPGMIRLNADGSYDTGFNENTMDDGVTDFAIQPDGNIIAVGYFHLYNGLTRLGIVRLLPDGSIDETFVAMGITDALEDANYIKRVLLKPDGKIVIAGQFETINGVPRKNIAVLNPNGSIFCPFDPGVGEEEPIRDIALMPDGDIMAIGAFTTYEGVVRNGLVRINYSDITAPTITITQQPADAVVCLGSNGTFTTNATGATNITYRWQFSATGAVGTFADISDGPNYTGTGTNTLVVNTTGNFGAGRYRCRINGDAASEVITANEGLFINPAPAVPVVTGNSACTPSALLLSASGGSAGQYRWYTVPASGTAIAGQTNSTYTTPLLSTTTTYYVSIDNGTCESIRVAAVATIGTIPAAPTVTDGTSCGPSNTVVLNASGGSSGQYRWYTVAVGGTAIAGAVNSAFTTPALTTTTTFYVAINNGPCEGSRTAVVANIVFCNQPPVIAAASATVPVSGSTTITLLSLISDPDNNLDLSTLSIVSNPTSGAPASLVNGVLSVNYAGISFAGPDQLTIRVCDVVGACVQRVVTIDVTGDVIVYNGISPNGDKDNDKWIIQYIELIPDTRENKVSIFNRWGDEVFATDNYDNQNRVFTGVGKNGNDLSSGTYFYKIEFTSGKAPLSGYITLKR